jgi:hypothetical protein
MKRGRPRKIYDVILERARQFRGVWPASELTPIMENPEQARRNCAHLARAGDLEVVSQGRRGKGHATLYRLAS